MSATLASPGLGSSAVGTVDLMGKGYSGGDPTQIADGGASLTKTSADIRSRSAGFNQAATAGADAGEDVLAAAIKRFGAASSQLAEDTGIQTKAAGELATNASTDLKRAGG